MCPDNPRASLVVGVDEFGRAETDPAAAARAAGLLEVAVHGAEHFAPGEIALARLYRASALLLSGGEPGRVRNNLSKVDGKLLDRVRQRLLGRAWARLAEAQPAAGEAQGAVDSATLALRILADEASRKAQASYLAFAGTQLVGTGVLDGAVNALKDSLALDD